MKRRLRWLPILAVAVAFVAASCTHKPVHPTKSEREWNIDHKACEEWVREGIRDEPDSYDNLDEMKMIKSCMEEKGWEWERTGWFRLQTEPTQ